MNDLNWYPYFKPDQVLTDQQLNQLSRYLLNQDRSTRAMTTGIGILCGLKASPVSGGALGIRIGRGIAITSAGYLIQHDATTYTHSRPFENESAYPDFAPYTSIRQLLTGEHSTDTSVTELSTTQLNEMVVVLFAQQLTVHPKACMKEHCDTEGSKEMITLKPLLIHADDAQDILVKQYDQTPKADILKTIHTPFDCPIPSMGRILKSDLETITSSATLANVYQKKIQALFTDPATALDTLLARLWEGAYCLLNRSTWMDDDSDTGLASVMASAHALNPFVAKPLFTLYEKTLTTPDRLQYVYDFIKKVLIAAKELRESLLHLSAACTPSTSLFPQHVFLGKPMVEPSVRPDFFRQDFVFAFNCMDHKKSFSQASVLMDRLSTMIDAFFIPASKLSQIKATPGAGLKSPLGSQAIPFYFNIAKHPDLLANWNPDLNAVDRSDENHSWHAGIVYAKDPQTAPVRHPSKYSLDKLDFFRIEGHIGFKSQAVEQKIESIVHAENLPFAIKTIRLPSAPDTSGKNLLESMNEFVITTPYKAKFASTAHKDVALEKTAPLIKLYTDQIKFAQADTIVDDLPEQITYLPQSHFQDMVSLFNHIRMQCMCELSGILTTLGQLSVPQKEVAGEIKVGIKKDISFSKDTAPGITFIGLDEPYDKNATAAEISKLILGEKDNIVGVSRGMPQSDYRLESRSGQPPRMLVAIADDGRIGWQPAKEKTSRQIVLTDTLEKKETKKILQKKQIAFAPARKAGSAPTIEDMYMEFDTSGIEDVHHFAKRYADIVEDAQTYIEVIEKPLTLLDALKKIYHHLSYDLFEFDFKGFSTVYKSAQLQAQDYLALLRSGKIQQTFAQQIAIALYESITKLAFGCGMLQLKLFFNEVLRRWEQIQNSDLFANFAKTHPGMEHLGGVSKGGTFVLVADTNDTVVADFSLPYITQSDVPAITVNRSQIVFKLPIQRFHNSDSSEYKFMVSPPGGTVSGNGGIRYDTLSGDYFFTPSAEDVPAGELTFTYAGDFGEKKLAVSVGGIDATFTAVEQTSTHATKRYMVFSANMDKADAYVWSFADGSPDKTGQQIEHIFTVSETQKTAFDVRLEVSLGDHVEPATQPIEFEPCSAQFTTKIISSALRLKLRQIQVTAQEKKAESYTWFVNGSLIEKTDSFDFTHQIPAGARVMTIGLSVAKGMCNIHNEKIITTTACSAQFSTPFIDRSDRRKGVLVKADDKTADLYQWLVNGSDKHKLSGPESVYVPPKDQTSVQITLSVQKGDCKDGPISKTISFSTIVIGRDFTDTIERSRTRTLAMADSESFGLVLDENSGIYEKTNRIFESIDKDLLASAGPEAYIKSNAYKTAVRSYQDLFKDSSTTIKKIRGRNAPEKQQVVAKLLAGQTEHFLTLVLADDKDITAAGSTARTLDLLTQTIKESASRDRSNTLKKELAAVAGKSLDMAKDKPELLEKLKAIHTILG